MDLKKSIGFIPLISSVYIISSVVQLEHFPKAHSPPGICNLLLRRVGKPSA